MLLEMILEHLVTSVPGARAAILADWEGEAVVTYTGNGRDEYEIKFVGAHHGILLNRARELAARVSLGRARQMEFVMDSFSVITAPVNDEYYLVLTMEPGALAPRARPAIYRAVREIEEDIG